ncbi:Heterokaryon incompatibility protein (HET) domain containing protein [Hyaloscypha variabilis]
MSSYQYKPLAHPESDLRLIYIDPGRYNDGVSCRFSPQYRPGLWVPSSGAITGISRLYQALSYTWGDCGRKVPILLDEQTFLVTENLEGALRHLRCSTFDDYTKVRPLWVDAICINQENIDERDSQVRRMKSIYEQAERVVIWIGKYNEFGDEIFMPSGWKIDRLENSEAMARSALVLCLVLKEEATQQEGSEISIGLEDCHHSDNLQVWAQLSRLFHRPWFERLWVIQELAASQNAFVQWGKLQIHWSTLEMAAKFILRPGRALPPQIHKMFPILGAHRITQVALQSMFNFDTNNILTILYNTQNAKCTDPRDRLYAIRGIVEDNHDIEIDYSIPVHQVYRNWAEKRIRRTNTVDIFSACADSSRGGDLPSWVPDLRRPFGQDKPLWIASQTSRNGLEKWAGQHGGLFCSDLHFSDDGLKVSLLGRCAVNSFKIFNLTSVGDVVTGLPDPTDLEVRLKQIVEDWKKTLALWVFGGKALTPRGFEETLLRSLYPWPAQPEDPLSMPYKFWRGDSESRSVRDTYIRSGRWDVSRHEVALRDFERSLFPRVHGCQMFTLENGRTGIVAGNCTAQLGDELWLLSGGRTAFILRRVSEVEHRLISPCYLFGAMYCRDSSEPWQEVILI